MGNQGPHGSGRLRERTVGTLGLRVYRRAAVLGRRHVDGDRTCQRNGSQQDVREGPHRQPGRQPVRHRRQHRGEYTINSERQFAEPSAASGDCLTVVKQP